MKTRLALASLFLGISLQTMALTVNVHVFNFDFGEAPPVHSDPIIEVGDTIHWIWDTSFHTVTSAALQTETYDSGLQNTGFTFDHTFTTVGKSGYFCGLHGFDFGNGTVGGMAGYIVVANTFLPNSFSIFRGILVSGGVPELQASDNLYLTVQKGLTLNASEAPIQVIFSTTSTVMAPTAMAVRFEDGVNASGLTRRLEVFNVQTNSFEQVDQSSAQLADKTTQVKATGNLARFVNQTTGAVQVKLSYFALGPVSNSAYQARFDRVAVLSN